MQAGNPRFDLITIKQYTTSYYILSIAYHEKFYLLCINLLYYYVFKSASTKMPNFYKLPLGKIGKIYGKEAGSVVQ